MAIRRFPIALALLLPTAWSQPQNADGWAARGKAMVAQFGTMLEAAKKMGEKIPAEDMEKYGHLNSMAQSLANRRWTQAFDDARWIAEHDTSPSTFQVMLGSFYLDGVGTAKNPDAAVHAFEQAAEGGAPEGMEMLGRMYSSNTGPATQDLEKAFHWYQMAAERGSKPG